MPLPPDHKLLIFLADDDEDDRQFFKEALDQSRLANELVSVSNGELLMGMLKERDSSPDFIFLDINMPRLNGIESLKLIRQHYRDTKVRVIMLSTAADQRVVDQSYRHGADLYIQKPGNFKELIVLIKYCLTELKQQANRDEFVLNDLLKFR